MHDEKAALAWLASLRARGVTEFRIGAAGAAPAMTEQELAVLHQRVDDACARIDALFADGRA